MESSIDMGLVGAIIGSLIGVAGGVFGTWCSIRAARGPRERSWIIKVSACAWLGALLLIAGVFLLPQPYNVLVWVPYSVALLLGVLWCNRRQQTIRAEEAPAGAE